MITIQKKKKKSIYPSTAFVSHDASAIKQQTMNTENSGIFLRSYGWDNQSVLYMWYHFNLEIVKGNGTHNGLNVSVISKFMW